MTKLMIQRIQDSLAQAITVIHKHGHIKLILQKLHCLSVEQRIVFKTAPGLLNTAVWPLASLNI